MSFEFSKFQAPPWEIGRKIIEDGYTDFYFLLKNTDVIITPPHSEVLLRTMNNIKNVSITVFK